MIKLKEFISIKKASLLNIILPYIIFNWNELSHSPFYKIENIIILLGILIIIEWLFKILINKINIIFFITLILICFYGYYGISFVQNNLGLNIRGRIVMLIIFSFLLIIIFIFNRKLKIYNFFNIFFLLFSSTLLVNQSNKKNNTFDLNNYKNNYLDIKQISNLDKPVILIISDEYTSPDGLYKIYRDSNVYNFSNKLVSNGWQVKNSFYSYEISTIHSLSSIFNFNLSKNISYKEMQISDLGKKKLMHASIYDSLRVKKISIINYGIFDIGESKPLNRLYFYPHNFLEEFLKNTSLYPIIYNTGELAKKGFEYDYYPMEEHNKFIFNNLKSNLLKVKDLHFFTYVHLYMPHAPMQFKPDFPLLNRSTNNYYKYWNFTNKKLDSLLNNLMKENKYRIVLTGDHGYRGDNRINPHYTFTAFYGFDSASIKHINSVQDLGSLINSGY